MKHDITALDLILYAHNEMSYMKKLAVDLELSQNPELRQELDQLHRDEAILAQDKSPLMQPPASILQNILDYSRSTTETYL